MKAAPPEFSARWYSDVSRYDWLILLIASAGWVFDQFESQLFIITRDPMLAELLGSRDRFARGEVLGRCAARSVSGRRHGRRRVVWQPGRSLWSQVDDVGHDSGLLRLLRADLFRDHAVARRRAAVLRGDGRGRRVGGGRRADCRGLSRRRSARASGIFHATSILGTWLAAAAGIAVGTHWRGAYVIGILPALLVLWVRSTVQEPERWRLAGAHGERMGSLSDLFGDRRWALRQFPGCASRPSDWRPSGA